MTQRESTARHTASLACGGQDGPPELSVSAAAATIATTTAISAKNRNMRASYRAGGVRGNL